MRRLSSSYRWLRLYREGRICFTIAIGPMFRRSLLFIGSEYQRATAPPITPKGRPSSRTKRAPTCAQDS